MQFKGFKPEALQKIAGSMGYQGDMGNFNQYLQGNPAAMQRMNSYQQSAMQMARGGYAKKYEEGGLSVDEETNSLDKQTKVDQPEQKTVPEVVVSRVEDPASNMTDEMKVDAEKVVYDDPTQNVGDTAGQAGDAKTGTTDKVETTATADEVVAGTAKTIEATKSGDTIEDTLDKTETATGEVSEDAKVTAEQQTESSVSDLKAEEGVAILMASPTKREIQDGELIEPTFNAAKAAKFAESIEAAEATPTEKATVQGQMASLTDNFDAANPPAWAAGALRGVTSQMAARGLSASSMAGQAMVQAALESALPIAQADAKTFASFESQNLSNRQARAMLAAEQRASFIGQEFDQAFQARVLNSSKIADVANMNFTAEQQVALENSRIANTMNLANLGNRQAMVMAEAAALSNLDMANLSNRQQAATQNAQSFMQMDMANLSNEQSTNVLNAQSRIQSLFNDVAADNAAKSFNATSENQVDQFYSGLKSQVSQFNATQTNAMEQYNSGQENAMQQFNANVQNQREEFNSSNRLVVDQFNANWRRQIATADNATVNRENELNAKAALDISNTAYNNLFTYYNDTMDWAFQTANSDRDRASNLAIAELNAKATIDRAKMAEDYQSSSALGSLVGNILTSSATSVAGSVLGLS